MISYIINNVFKNIIHGAVNLLAVRDEFKEGICPANVLIANNKFIGNHSADISILSWGSLGSNGGITKGLIKGVNITNNFFADCPVSSMKLTACGNSEVTGNLFYNTSIGESVVSGIFVDYADNLKINNNYFYSDVKARMTAIESGSHCTDVEKKNNKFKKLD